MRLVNHRYWRSPGGSPYGTDVEVRFAVRPISVATIGEDVFLNYLHVFVGFLSTVELNSVLMK